ncbi:MAG TPA: citrate/2-methylcitrate synthase [Dehalococcoidia bacterium]|nr:citrate/2-methylcitrate synthase [Dehalococcoidia bacterium]
MSTRGTGLKGVVLDESRISLVDGDAGKLVYRGYNIHDLAQHATFEEVCYLLLYGALPKRAQLQEFDHALKAARAIPEQVIDIMDRVKAAHPMDVLRTAVSAIVALDESGREATVEVALPAGIRLISQVATIVAAMHRMRGGMDPVAPREDLGHAANFLYMMFGREPSREDAKIIDLDLVLHAEHSSNASTFAARVAAGTAADLGSAIVAAIATLKGPLHGGAAEAVQKTVEEIGDPERAIAYIKEKIEAGDKVMGFGHRVYKTEDPRAAELRGVARDLGHARGNDRWFQILQEIEKAMEPYRPKGIYPNVDFYAGAVYSLLGIPDEQFIPMFAVGRMPGWIANVLEQYEDNVLIRPLLDYTGPRHLKYVPIDER